MSKPKIYGCVNTPYENGEVEGIAIAEDGTILAGHYSSNEKFLRHDLGMDGRSTWKHDKYATHYPDGYEVEFVFDSEAEKHEGLLKALAIANGARS